MEFTVDAGNLDASRRWKEAIPAFSASQAGRLQESEAPIVMKWVIARFVVAIDRDTLETVYGPPCEPDKSHWFPSPSPEKNTDEQIFPYLKSFVYMIRVKYNN